MYPSVPALAASASVETSKQRYTRVSLKVALQRGWVKGRGFAGSIYAQIAKPISVAHTHFMDVRMRIGVFSRESACYRRTR